MLQTSKNRVFLDTLHSYRADVFEYVQTLEDAYRIASYLFDSFTRLASSNKTQLDPASLNVLHEQLKHLNQTPANVSIKLMNGVVLSLEQALTLLAPPVGTHDVINALFAIGLQQYLENKQASEKQNVITRVIKLMPGIERLGPFLLSDYIDYACNAEDSDRFWKAYVEKVASELEKRTADVDMPTDTWTLSSLLKLHDLGTSALAGKKLEVLKKHLERILQSRRVEWHWRFLKQLSEVCQDPKMLYFIFNSPAVIEGPEIALHFITKCSSKLISCGLFILQISKAKKMLVREILRFFDESNIDENGERLVEVYAQIQLMAHPSKMIQALKNGILELLKDKIQDQPIDVLLNSIKNDAKTFRQVLLLVDLVPSERKVTNSKQLELLERVLQSFFHAFTPSGVKHVLNDHIYRDGVARSIVEQIRIPQQTVSNTLSSFAENLNYTAQRWIPDDNDLPKRHLLLSLFIGIFANTIRLAAAPLYHNEELRPKGLLLYKILVDLYLSNPIASAESSGYANLNPLMSSLYPELITEEYIDPPSPERIEQAVFLMAEIEAEQYDLDEIDGDLFERRKSEVVEEEIPVISIQKEPTPLPVATSGGLDLNFGLLDDTQEISTKAALADAYPTATQSAIKAYLGVYLFAFLTRKLLNSIGIYKEGLLSFSQKAISFTENHKKADEVLASTQMKFHPSQLSAIKIYQPFKTFYFVLGICGMIFLGFIGGHLIFTALRGSELVLGLIGFVLLLLALAFDASMNALYRLGNHKILVELYQQNQEKPLAVYLDKKSLSAQRMIDALLNAESQRKEELFNPDWSNLFSNTESPEPAVESK